MTVRTDWLCSHLEFLSIPLRALCEQNAVHYRASKSASGSQETVIEKDNVRQRQQTPTSD